MKPRKLRIPTGGAPLPGATQLKQLPGESRLRIAKLFDTLPDEEIIKQIELDFGVNCSLSALRSFRQWQYTQMRWESRNELLEQFEKLCAQKNPAMSREKVRDLGITVFLAEELANKDRKGFVDVAHLSLAEETGKTKAANEQKKIQIAERRVALLEKKADQADKAKGLLENTELTEKEKEAQMRALFGLT
jgi:hypothetical protein